MAYWELPIIQMLQNGVNFGRRKGVDGGAGGGWAEKGASVKKPLLHLGGGPKLWIRETKRQNYLLRAKLRG